MEGVKDFFGLLGLREVNINKRMSLLLLLLLGPSNSSLFNFMCEKENIK